MNSFYAVAVGKKTGVFTNWNECKESIDDFKGAVYRKFTSIDEASEFVADYLNTLYVYTDGACINNGSKNAKAGIGIFFSKDSEFNQSVELTSEDHSKLTNNIAELKAIIGAINIIESNREFQKFKNKVIVTDSAYAIKCATTFGSKLAEREWKEKKDKPVPNIELVKELYELVQKTNIKFKHVDAHTGNKDRHSVGNYYADLLANKSIHNEDKPKIISSQPRVYLNVKYEDKDDAKSKGARWDASQKKWYIFEDNKNKKELLIKYR